MPAIIHSISTSNISRDSIDVPGPAAKVSRPSYGHEPSKAPGWSKKRAMLAALMASGHAYAQTSIDPAKAVQLAKIVAPAGSGTPADANLVASHLARLPLPLLQRMTNDRTPFKVLACKNNVTDVMPSLLDTLYFNATADIASQNLTAYNVTSIFWAEPNLAIVAATASNGTVISTIDDLGRGNAALYTAALWLNFELGTLDRFGRGVQLSSSPAFVTAFSQDAAGLGAIAQDNTSYVRQAVFAEYFAQTLNVPASRSPAPRIYRYFADLLCGYGERVVPQASQTNWPTACSTTISVNNTAAPDCGTLVHSTAANGSLAFTTRTAACPSGLASVTTTSNSQVSGAVTTAPSGSAAGPTISRAQPTQSNSDGHRRAQLPSFWSWL